MTPDSLRRLGALLIVVAVACGDTAATVPADGPLPPHGYADLEPLLTPLIDSDRYRITRASLIETDTYTASPTGTHLAVYLEPLRRYEADDYASEIAPTAAWFIPSVFERWEGLASFDVCLEPHDWGTGSTAPSVTIVDVTREQAATVDWATVDLADLLAAAGPGFTVWATTEVRTSPVWTGAAG